MYLWNNGKNSAGKTLGLEKRAANTEELEAEAKKDTDGDGLLNWEEKLWRTNPEVTDTDGDDTSDGDEVKTGRDPEVAGTCGKELAPSKIEGCTDKLQNPEELTGNTDSEESSTFTAKIARGFATNYFAGKGIARGEHLSASAQQSLADSITLGIEQGFAAYQDVFHKEDLKISESLDPKVYLNRLGDNFVKNFKNISSSELDILNAVVSGKHFENTKLFDSIIEAYKNMVFYLQKETVPKSYTDLHLEILNIMQNTLFAVRSMQAIEKDPAKAMVGIRLYAKEIERTGEFLKNLKQQIEKGGIKFTEEEGGIFFIKYFEQI